MEVIGGKQFAAYMKSMRRRTLEVAAEIPEDKQNWRLTEDSMSPAQVLYHIGTVERSLWGAGLSGGRAVPLEEASSPDLTLAEALEFLKQTRAENVKYWNSLTPEDLDSEIITPTGHKHVLKRWLVLASEHEIHHRGFLHAYRKFWGMESHPIYGLTLDTLRANLNRQD